MNNSFVTLLLADRHFSRNQVYHKYVSLCNTFYLTAFICLCHTQNSNECLKENMCSSNTGI